WVSCVQGARDVWRRVGAGPGARRRPRSPACGVEGEPRSEPPGQTGKDLRSDVVPLVVRVLPREKRDDGCASDGNSVLLHRVLGPVPVQTAVHAEGWRPSVCGPSAELDTTVLIPT